MQTQTISREKLRRDFLDKKEICPLCNETEFDGTNAIALYDGEVLICDICRDCDNRLLVYYKSRLGVE